MYEKKQYSPLDRQLAIKFFKKAVHNKFMSVKEGKQVFQDVDYISIRIPGDKTTEINRKVSEDDKERFSVQWENYQKRLENIQDGTAIEMLPGISPADAENWKSKGFETIEQLTGMSEQNIQRSVQGTRDIVTRAKKYLDGGKYTEDLERKLAKLEDEIKTLKEVKNEPVVNNTKRRKRNPAGGGADNSSRK